MNIKKNRENYKLWSLFMTSLGAGKWAYPDKGGGGSNLALFLFSPCVQVAFNRERERERKKNGKKNGKKN